MLITVKYGDEQQQIFNAACRNDILLHYIKTHCQCQKEDVVELSDERGIVKNLRLFPKEYATTYLKNREALVLLRVNTCKCNLVSSPDASSPSPNGSEETVEKTVFTPLLSSLIKNNDFIDAINPATTDDVFSESSKAIRRRSSMTDSEEKNPKLKSRGGSLNNPNRKPVSRRGPRPPLRKSANTS